MTIPRIPSLLIMLALGQDAFALQMGQVAGESVRGQPLMARVGLYGVTPAAGSGINVELLPPFGASPDLLAHYGLAARLVNDAREGQAIILTSTRPIDLAVLTLRVRLAEGDHALVRHYELNIPSAPALPVARAARNAPTPRARSGGATRKALPTRDLGASGEYGPVRAGQSLWTILAETGLANGDTQALMRDIVAANPTAFVGGDASRLRVGVMLRLPTNGASAPPAVPKLPALTPRADAEAIDADTAARIARLAKKFEAIRARYAAQQAQAAAGAAQTASAKDNPAVAVKAAPESSSAAVAKSDTPAPAKVAPAKPRVTPTAKEAPAKPAPTLERGAQPSALDTLATFVDGRVLLGVGSLLLLVALVIGGLQLGRRLRMRMADAGMRSADRDMVAEIARKTEKRVQLEDEVKRMMAGRMEGNESSGQSPLRPADLLAGVRGTLEEIETRIAHGQYNEAEAMLEQTIVDAPNNFRAKLRLAEIYYLNERHEEFVDLAEEIHRQHRSDIGDENWARLMRMGKVIAPDRPPFSGPVAVEAGRRAR